MNVITRILLTLLLEENLQQQDYEDMLGTILNRAALLGRRIMRDRLDPLLDWLRNVNVSQLRTTLRDYYPLRRRLRIQRLTSPHAHREAAPEEAALSSSSA